MKNSAYIYNKVREIMVKGILPFCLMVVLPLILSSCSLEEKPRDQIPEEMAYTTKETLFQNTVATLYNYIGGHVDGEGLQGTCRGVYDLQTFGSDEAMLPTRGGDWYDGGMWQEMYKHSWSAGHELVSKSWMYLYKVITLCNTSLEVLETHKSLLTPSELEEYQAEVHALRAIYYWYLLDLFGNVPIVTSASIPIKDVKQSPRSEVFKFCVSELDEHIDALAPEKSCAEGDYYGRVTMPVACFVLAKLMLNAPVYLSISNESQEAKAYYKRCIELCDLLGEMGFKLEDYYSDCFAVHNHNSVENIFSIPMDDFFYTNHQENIIRSLHYRHAAAFGFVGENGTSATQRVLDIYGYGTDNVDPRFYYNFYADEVIDLEMGPVTDRTGNQLIYYPREVALDLSNSPYKETAGARMRKYEIDRNGTKDGKLIDNDIVLFRYSDVLLMRAEAKLRVGLDGHEDYDAVRQRFWLPKRPYTLQNLLDERMLELCWEGWRRQDLIRFGQYRSLYDGPDAVDESDGHTTLFPIPSSICVLAPNIDQNPGY